MSFKTVLQKQHKLFLKRSFRFYILLANSSLNYSLLAKV